MRLVDKEIERKNKKNFKDANYPTKRGGNYTNGYGIRSCSNQNGGSEKNLTCHSGVDQIHEFNHEVINNWYMLCKKLINPPFTSTQCLKSLEEKPHFFTSE